MKAVVTSKKKQPPLLVPPLAAQLSRTAIFARYLDLAADAELQHGHHRAAERLAHRAAQLRGWA